MLPVTENNRIESLDVLRGYALLGILLLNILGFGLVSASYSNPGFDLLGSTPANIITWASIELFAEGAMRCLFSILFGAGVVLFTTGERGKSYALHYKRTFWLLIFGLFDAYILLWNGDILVTYALAGAVLYFARNLSVKTLLSFSAGLIFLMSAFHGLSNYGLSQTQAAAQIVNSSSAPDVIEAAKSWVEFESEYNPDSNAVSAELDQRRDSYVSAFLWNADKVNKMLAFVVPVYLFWDALAMMILGMALYKAKVLQGTLATSFYFKLMVIGLVTGFGINAYEIARGLNSQFDLIAVFAQLQVTYHLGRLAVAMGYIGLIIWISHQGYFAKLRQLLSAVGRMALTNYLMQSLICAVLFTGLGFSLVNQLDRVSLYGIVFLIWVFQLFFSQWWLSRYRFGPVEWLWRALTYGERPKFIRQDKAQEALKQ